MEFNPKIPQCKTVINDKEFDLMFFKYLLPFQNGG